MANVPAVGEIALEVHEDDATAPASLNPDSTENGEITAQENETDCLLRIHDNQAEQEQQQQLNMARNRNGNPGDDEEVDPHQQDARHLFEIEKNDELRLSLREWENGFKLARERIEKKSTRALNAKNAKLYQMIGFYSVFQGVVLTAVAQSTTIHCRQSWGPASLSLLASLVTVASVHFKLRSYGKEKSSLNKEIRDSKVLHEQISELKAKGAKFRFSWFKTKSNAEGLQSNKPPKEPQGLQRIYYLAVMAALLIFSTIILLCCIVVLCGPKSTCGSG